MINNKTGKYEMNKKGENKMKKAFIISMLLVLFITLAGCNINKMFQDNTPTEKYQKLEGEEAYTEGDGTVNNPYVIDTKGKLIYLSNQLNEDKGQKAYYELQADIDLEGINWNPIKRFEGHFNGNGYEISNFVIKNKYQDRKYYTGLIGLFQTNYGTIKKLGVTNFDIDMTWKLKAIHINAGGITATNHGNIINCYAIGTITIKLTNEVGDKNATNSDTHVGGIAGKNGGASWEVGNITNCFAVVKCEDVSAPEAFTYGISNLGNIDNSVAPNQYYYINHYDPSSDVITPSRINVEIEELSNKEFYLTKLNWDENIWDLNDIEFVDDAYSSNHYPKLKRS